MRTSTSLFAWKYGVAPAIASGTPAMYFLMANLGGWASLQDALFAFAIWFLRDFVLAFVLVVPVAALMRHLGASPIWYWVSASALGIPMGCVLANPLMEWHPTPEQINSEFQVHTMIIYALLFGLGAFVYGLKVEKLRAHEGG